MSKSVDNSKETKNIDRLIRLYRSNYVRHDNVFLQDSFISSLPTHIKGMEIRSDDIWVCSFPRSGTTLTQEMVWCIMNDRNTASSEVALQERFPFLEQSFLNSNLKDKGTLDDTNSIPDSILKVQGMKSPRFIKTHLPYKLLPEMLQKNHTLAKIIYIYRDPRDVCISFYHMKRLFKGQREDFETHCELFLHDAECYAPYWEHVLDFWNKRSQPNILFLRYSDVINDLRGEIIKTSTFLGKTLSEEKLTDLIKHLSFEEMKNNGAVNNGKFFDAIVKEYPERKNDQFIRCGKAGSWKELLSIEMQQKFHLYNEKFLKNTDFAQYFDY